MTGESGTVGIGGNAAPTIEVQTRGVQSSEFWLLVASNLVVIAIVIGENVFGWSIDDTVKNTILTQVGGNAAYAGFRSWYKSSKVKAIASLLSPDLVSAALAKLQSGSKR